MKECVRKHVEDELINLKSNKCHIEEIGEMIKEGVCERSREYLVLYKRVARVQFAIMFCQQELSEIYKNRYLKKMSWVAIAFKMNVSEATVKRYNRKLLEVVAKSLGWE